MKATIPCFIDVYLKMKNNIRLNSSNIGDSQFNEINKIDIISL